MNQARAVTLEHFRELMREVYKAQGFIVIGCPPSSPRQFQIGDQTSRLFEYEFTDGTLFQVVAASTEVELERQLDLISTLRPTWHRGNTQLSGATYYRVIALRRKTL